MTALAELRADLADEHEDLDRLVAGLPDGAWTRPTPAEGWTVADQIGHLGYFDRTARLAVTDPEAFAAHVDELLATDDLAAAADTLLDGPRALAPPELLEWWRDARRQLLEAAASLSPGDRVDWYGPSMSAASFLTARLMETWAHGQDVADALGRERTPTDRLRHVAHLGVITRPHSYLVRGLDVPDGDVRVELTLPSGAVRTWGPDDADDLVRGSALDFCLVVVQRRHVDDTELEVRGPAASEWMRVAQAYAGEPGTGREPGRFR